MPHNVRVCIIVAGVAGLKAAHTLLTAPSTPFGSTDVVVLEAQHRVGGRIKTDTTRSKVGAQYDLGAAWFHDALNNSVLRECVADGSFDARSDGYFDDKTMAHYALEVSGRLDAEEMKLWQVVEDIETFIEIYYASHDSPDMLLRDVVGLYMEQQQAFLSEWQINYCSRMVRYLELWHGIDHVHMSGKYAVMSHEGRNLYNRKGFSHLINLLMQTVGPSVLTGHPVKRIQRKSRGTSLRHIVETADGSVFSADYLVVTVPHSVLALDAGHEDGITWEPPLPRSMTDSILNMHFGALGKVVLEFESVWWDKNEDRFSILANGRAECVSGSPKPFEYPLYVINYARIYAGTPSLVVLIQSPVTEHLEANPHLAWPYMRSMLLKLKVPTCTTVPEPINVIVTDWSLNPYSRGSYCAAYVGDDPIDEVVQLSGEHDLCGLGAGSTVRFAGEHTISHGAGCVHGAFDSGERAARWILAHSESLNAASL